HGAVGLAAVAVDEQEFGHVRVPFVPGAWQRPAPCGPPVPGMTNEIGTPGQETGLFFLRPRTRLRAPTAAPAGLSPGWVWSRTPGRAVPPPRPGERRRQSVDGRTRPETRTRLELAILDRHIGGGHARVRAVPAVEQGDDDHVSRRAGDVEGQV